MGFTFEISLMTKYHNTERIFFRNDLGKLKYVHLCIKESNRLYSVVPQISRSLDKPYEIDGKMIPEGTSVRFTIFTWVQYVCSALTLFIPVETVRWQFSYIWPILFSYISFVIFPYVSNPYFIFAYYDFFGDILSSLSSMMSKYFLP